MNDIPEEPEGIDASMDEAGAGIDEVVKISGSSIDPEFLETLRSLGVDESQIEISDDVLCEPVEIFVTLAKNGDINPWDIDIVEVTDKFLAYIEDLKIMDLRISGRTLLYASILLRMKSIGIVQEEEEVDDDLLDDDMDFYDIKEYPVPKLPIRRTATRPVTLQELITELKKAEKVETRRKDRRIRRRLEVFDRVTTDDVLGIAHEEDIRGRVDTLYTSLEELFRTRDEVMFSDLVDWSGSRSERLMTYISLLFLASEKKVLLAQEELFGELFVLPPAVIE
ncbi:segregation/condensation protein A [Methanococcoides alaskense]|uniref:Segregation and condensation protein A n=1 Tax=Methanococcoides alaskense TaxID=325778 RepID=A0AA90TYR5_9EURY|nr:ScpA family protein [Methanococcoides alaskense]MDA0524937.1 ScpA family protein [Methanococcoides alaskense]MDR6222148.1 segregation and condensation protein A [Methanococcoides alaskense]